MISKAYLEITNICNLSCTFCHKTSREIRMMSAEEFEALTEKLRSIPYLYFHLMGEPTAHPLLPEFIKTARDKGFRPILTTNGSLLAKCGGALLDALPHKLNISLHAPAANPAFADKSYLDNCILFAKEASARGCITVLRLWNLGSEGEAENSAILEKLHTAFPDEWVPYRSGSSLCLDQRIFLEWGDHFDWPDPDAPEIPADAEAFCHGLRNQIGVLCDGTVVPCCLDADGNIALGNLFESSLSDILDTERARAIYDGFSRRRAAEELCRKCGYARRFLKLSR